MTPRYIILSTTLGLIEFFETGALELYNLNSESGERANLVSQEPAKARGLHAALTNWRRQVGTRMPVPNPHHDPTRTGEIAAPAC